MLKSMTHVQLTALNLSLAQYLLLEKENVVSYWSSDQMEGHQRAAMSSASLKGRVREACMSKK